MHERDCTRLVGAGRASARALLCPSTAEIRWGPCHHHLIPSSQLSQIPAYPFDSINHSVSRKSDLAASCILPGAGTGWAYRCSFSPQCSLPRTTLGHPSPICLSKLGDAGFSGQMGAPEPERWRKSNQALPCHGLASSMNKLTLGLVDIRLAI